MSSSSSRSSSPLSALSRSPSPPSWADSLTTDTITVASPVKKGPGRPRKNIAGVASSFVAATPSDPPHTKKEKGCTATVLEPVTSQRRSNRIPKLKKEEPQLVRGSAPVVCGKRKRGSDDLYQDEEVSTTKRPKCVKGADLVLAALAQEPPTGSVVAQKRKRGSIDSAQENDSDYTSKCTKVASAQNQVLARAERRRKRLTQEELAAEEDIALYKSKSIILQNLARAGPEDLPSYGRFGTSPPDRGGSLTPEPLPPVIADLGFVVGSASTSQKLLNLSKKGLNWDGDLWNGEQQRWSQQRVHKKSGIPYATGAAKGKHPPIDMK